MREQSGTIEDNDLASRGCVKQQNQHTGTATNIMHPSLRRMAGHNSVHMDPALVKYASESTPSRATRSTNLGPMTYDESIHQHHEAEKRAGTSQ